MSDRSTCVEPHAIQPLRLCNMKSSKSCVVCRPIPSCLHSWLIRSEIIPQPISVAVAFERRQAKERELLEETPAISSTSTYIPSFVTSTGLALTNAQKGKTKAKATANGKAKHNGAHAGNGKVRSSNGHSANGTAKGIRSNGNGARPSNGSSARTAKPSASSWSQRNGHTANGHSKSAKPAGKPTANGRGKTLARPISSSRNASGPGKAARPDSRSASRNGASRKPALAAGAKAGNSKQYGFTARPSAARPKTSSAGTGRSSKDTKKRG